jgi:hypothetical protein
MRCWCLHTRALSSRSSLTVSVPLALAPEVSCVHDAVLVFAYASSLKSIRAAAVEARNGAGDVRAGIELQRAAAGEGGPAGRPPDATSSVPPLIAVATAVPPLLTSSEPPLKMIVPLAWPLRSTISWPPARRVPDVVRPDETISKPPDTVAPIAVPLLDTTSDPAKTTAPLASPESISTPPEMCAPRSVPPRTTLSVPPLLMTVALAMPPELTVSRPPLDTVVLIAVPPLDTVSSRCWRRRPRSSCRRGARRACRAADHGRAGDAAGTDGLVAAARHCRRERRAARFNVWDPRRTMSPDAVPNTCSVPLRCQQRRCRSVPLLLCSGKAPLRQRLAVYQGELPVAEGAL